MTEAEWLLSLDPVAVFQRAAQKKPSQRKMRLVSVGCCRRIWHLLHDERSRRAVEVAEEYAERRAGRVGLMPEANVQDTLVIEEQASAVVNTALEFGQDAANDAAATAAVCLALWAMADWGTLQAVQWTSRIIGRQAPIEVIACVFGIPYRRFTPPQPWLTSTVVALAEGIYADRAFDRLPILADALQDAGCDHADILTHCRSDGPHVRGCWAVDLVLGKE